MDNARNVVGQVWVLQYSSKADFVEEVWHMEGWYKKPRRESRQRHGILRGEHVSKEVKGRAKLCCGDTTTCNDMYSSTCITQMASGAGLERLLLTTSAGGSHLGCGTLVLRDNAVRFDVRGPLLTLVAAVLQNSRGTIDSDHFKPSVNQKVNTANTPFGNLAAATKAYVLELHSTIVYARVTKKSETLIESYARIRRKEGGPSELCAMERMG